MKITEELVEGLSAELIRTKKQGIEQERTRWVAAVEGMMHEAMADERLTGRDQDAIVHLLQTLLTRMEAS